MKKLFVLMMAILMTFSLTACGAPEKKLAEVDAGLAKLESLYQENVTLIDKIDNTGYDDVQKVHDDYKAILDGIKADLDSMKKTFTENRDGYDEESVDQLLEVNKNTIAEMEKNNIAVKEEIAAMEKAVAEANATG